MRVSESFEAELKLSAYTVCAYTYAMDFIWDPRKASENLRKHGVDFADAVLALEDENALTIKDCDHNEQRFKTLGMGPYTTVLFVVHAERGEDLFELFLPGRRTTRRSDSITRA